MTETILRLPEVMKATGLSHMSIYRLERAGKFPKRLQLGKRAVGWKESAIAAWIESRIEGIGKAELA